MNWHRLAGDGFKKLRAEFPEYAVCPLMCIGSDMTWVGFIPPKWYHANDNRSFTR